MNKIAVAVAALVVVVLLAVPPALGTLTESRVRERVAAIAGNGLITVELKSFDRGWFRSKAKIEFGLTPDYLAKMGATGSPASVLGQHATIAVDFVHGPVVVQNGVHFGWSTMVTRLDPETPGLAQIEQQLGVPYLFEFRSRTGLAGGVTFDANVPPMAVPTGTAQFKFSGATLYGRYAGKRIVSNARANSVDFASPRGAFTLRNLRVSTDNEILAQDLMPGKGEFSIESISAIDPLQGSTPVFQVDNLKVTGASTLNAAQTLLDIQVTYGLDRLHIAENELTGATMGFAFHNLDVATFQHYNTAIRELAFSGTPPNPQDVITELRADIERALAAGPSLVFDPIRFAFDGEPFEGRAEITIDPAKVPPGGITGFDPAIVMGFVNGKGDVKLSKALARRLVALAAEMQFRGDARMPPEQLTYMAEAQAGLILVQLVNQGFLVEDGEVYRTALHYVDGALTLNDRPLPFGLQ